MFGQQITGQAFPSQYGVVFYQSQGFGDKSFLFNIIQNILSLVAIFFTWSFIDGIGRRPILMVGGTLMALWLFILGGMGSSSNINSAGKGLVVASVMLFQFFFNLSWAPSYVEFLSDYCHLTYRLTFFFFSDKPFHCRSYVVLSEAAASRLKEKTNLLASVISVLTTFVTSFTIPYLINERYANLGAKVGFIYGAINVIMVVLTFFFIPELKGRTLEEVDQLFASGVPLRKFGSVETKSAQTLYQDELKQKSSYVESEKKAAELVEKV